MARELPDTATAGAFKTPGGEYAWRPANLSRALQAAAAEGFANLGGEAWIVKDGLFYTSIPLEARGPEAVCTWITAKRRPNESWNQYCTRTASETISELDKMNLSKEVRSDLRDSIYVNITFVEESDV